MKKFFLSIAASFVLFAGNFADVSAACDGACDYCCTCGCNGEVYDNLSAGDYENFAVEVLNLVNAERAKVGAPPLRLAEDLQQSAMIRAREIVQYFSHTRPDGSSCFTVMQNRGRSCAENIAAGNSTPAETVDQWMNSEGHRTNILNPQYRELGVGYAHDAQSQWNYYWVQLFRG